MDRLISFPSTYGVDLVNKAWVITVNFVGIDSYNRTCFMFKLVHDQQVHEFLSAVGIARFTIAFVHVANLVRVSSVQDNIVVELFQVRSSRQLRPKNVVQRVKRRHIVENLQQVEYNPDDGRGRQRFKKAIWRRDVRQAGLEGKGVHCTPREQLRAEDPRGE